MAIRIVRLGTARAAGEGTRIGTVRRPPRGVPKELFASGNWYDVWFPNLAPSVETMKLGQAVESPADLIHAVHQLLQTVQNARFHVPHGQRQRVQVLFRDALHAVMRPRQQIIELLPRGD